MVNSGRRHSASPVSDSVRKMRRRRSSPAMSKKRVGRLDDGDVGQLRPARGEQRGDFGGEGGDAGHGGACSLPLAGRVTAQRPGWG